MLLYFQSARVCRSATALLKKATVAELSGELQEIVEKYVCVLFIVHMCVGGNVVYCIYTCMCIYRLDSGPRVASLLFPSIQPGE